MNIDAFFTSFFPERDNLFDGALVVMIDVLRASSTICASLYNGAKEVIPVENTDKAVHIYSSLSKEIRFLGGERGGVKLKGFDAGNSPLDYKEELVKGKSVVLTTTNGTVIFQKAKKALYRIIGGFVNLTMVHNFLLQQLNSENHKINDIFFLCAGNKGRFSYEDALCAGAFINILSDLKPEFNLTDTSNALLDLYELHSSNLYDFIKEREHAKLLHNLGFDEDIKICTEIDRYPVVPVFSGSSIVKLIIAN